MKLYFIRHGEREANILREFDTGILEGKSDPESWDIHSQVFNQWLSSKLDAHIPVGQRYLDIQARFIPFIEGLQQQFSIKNILLVGMTVFLDPCSR